MSAQVFWFTGLSGVGKSTLAGYLRDRLRAEGWRVLTLDGDDVRNSLHRHLGFSPQDIKENNALIVQLCGDNRNDYDAILVPIISPYMESREMARTRLSPGFHEIHVMADLSVLGSRDTKGLYAAAAKNEIDNLIGVSPSNPYEAPETPDMRIDTGIERTAQSCERLYVYALTCLRGSKATNG